MIVNTRGHKTIKLYWNDNYLHIIQIKSDAREQHRAADANLHPIPLGFVDRQQREHNNKTYAPHRSIVMMDIESIMRATGL